MARDYKASNLSIQTWSFKKRATVGIICDESGKPTHCISRKDLSSFLLNVS